MTLTMESCTLTVQPSQTSTNSKTALRSRRWTRRDRDSGAWNTNTPVTTASSTARIAILPRASRHASIQAGTGGSSGISTKAAGKRNSTGIATLTGCGRCPHRHRRR